MLNSVRLLTNVASENIFDVIETRYLPVDCSLIPFHIRLWQGDRNERYIPSGSVTVTVEFMRMQTVAQIPLSQTIVKTLTQTFGTDGSIWNCNLVAADVANITAGGFKVTVTEGANITKIYSKMAIRKLPSSDWPLL